MASNNPPSLGLQLDRCDVCGNKIHRRELVRTQVEYVKPTAENYHNYSYYDGTYWVCDASDAGSISYGNRCDKARTQVPTTQPTAVGGMSVVSGVQTWEGDGTFRSTVLTPSFSVRSSSLFSAYIGPHMENETPEMTVSMGVTNSDGSSKQEVRSWTIRTMKRVWFSELTSVLAAYGLGSSRQLYYYIQVTNDGKWWIDELQLEANTPSSSGGVLSEAPVAVASDYLPGTFLEATGSYPGAVVESSGLAARKVCPNCFETVFKKSERYGRSDEPQVDYPVEPYAQEF